MIWSCFLVVFIKLEFAAVYLATSAFALIYLNLGNESSKTGRREGNMSAYSVFNPGCESIDGTLTAQQFEREIKVQEFVWVAYLFRQLEILVVGAIVGSLGERTCHACLC